MLLLYLGLTWQPYFDPLTILGSAVLLALIAIVCYARTARERTGLSAGLLAMRLTLIVVLGGLLMGPSVLPDTGQQEGRGTLTLMVDTSGSMRVDDMDGLSRFEFVAQNWLSAEQLAALRQEYDLKLIGFDDAPRPISESLLRRPADEAAIGSESNLIRSVEQVVAQRGGDDQDASILVLSDGRDRSDRPVQPAAQMARSQSVPVHTVVTGGPNVQRDLAVVARPEQPYLLLGEQGTMLIEVMQSNAAHTRTTLHMRGPEGEHSEEVAFGEESSLSFALPIEPESPGLHAYEIEVEPIDGEVETANNKQTVFAQVSDERLEVLIVEGQPYWDTRFIAQTLRADERVALTQVTQVAMGQQSRIVTRSESEGTLPSDAQGWAGYDVVVLGRDLENVLSLEQADLLSDYVAEGGRLIFARGRAYDPQTSEGRAMGRVLSSLEPVIWDQGRVAAQQVMLADHGRNHPSFAMGPADSETDIDQAIARLPALQGIAAVSRVKTATRVLAHGQDAGGAGADQQQPVLVEMPYNRGQVVAVVGEGLWRWHLHEQQDEDALEGLFERFWSNMVRSLAMGADFTPGQEVAVRVSESSVRVGRTQQIIVSSRHPLPEDADPRVIVETPDGQQSEFALDAGPGSMRQHVDVEPAEPGVYEVSVLAGELTSEPVRTRFSSYDVDMQMLDSAADPGLMRALADGSGGQFLDPDDPKVLSDVLTAHRAMMSVPPQPEYVWNHAWLLVLVLGWAGTEWFLRKKGGLL